MRTTPGLIPDGHGLRREDTVTKVATRVASMFMIGFTKRTQGIDDLLVCGSIVEIYKEDQDIKEQLPRR